MKIKSIYYLLFLYLFTESVSYVSGNYLAAKGVFYVPQAIHHSGQFSKAYQDYLVKRDRVLGWPSPQSFGNGDFAQDGSRVSPAVPGGNEPCVSTYGDSFTWGAEVANKDAWPNILSTLLNCKVSNYGVEGYGTDQAYLRFLKNASDKSQTVIFSFTTENILRNVNQYRQLLYPNSKYIYGLKPRFTINADGTLRLIDLPAFLESEFRSMVHNPNQYLSYEYFLPGGLSGKQELRFPYFFSLLRAFHYYSVRAKLLKKPWYAEFYDERHPSQALEITAKIIESFRNDALRKGKKPIIVIIPTGLDLQYYRRKGVWVYQPLLDRLESAGIRFLNAGPAILDSVGNRNVCELFQTCNGHYNEEGNRVLAVIISAYLRST